MHCKSKYSLVVPLHMLWGSVGDIRCEASIDKRNMLQHMNEQSYGHPGLGHPVPDRLSARIRR